MMNDVIPLLPVMMYDRLVRPRYYGTTQKQRVKPQWINRDL